MKTETKTTDTPIYVPLDPDSRAALESRADANDRAMGREAAVIIKERLAADAAQEQEGKPHARTR